MRSGPAETPTTRLFLAGDVMLGRGIDQILPHPSDPVLNERYVRSARDYVRLAEEKCGKLPRGVAFDYVWGDLREDLDALACDRRVINLETAVTRSRTWAPKGINYRMNPANLRVLNSLRVDLCTLANNHVLDWGREGLAETLEALSDARIAQAGAGMTRAQALKPQVLDLPGGGRLLVIARGSETSGIPPDWAAGDARPGIALLGRDPDAVRAEVAECLAPIRRAGDITVFSVHWGGNWGYGVDDVQRATAHALIEGAGVDVVHGHSSHHPKAIEFHRGRLILHGSGDLINDYEGIGGHDRYRSDLVLGYVADLAANGACRAVTALPYRIRAFRLQRATDEERAWLVGMLARESRGLGVRVQPNPDGSIGVDPAPGT